MPRTNTTTSRAHGSARPRYSRPVASGPAGERPRSALKSYMRRREEAARRKLLMKRRAVAGFVMLMMVAPVLYAGGRAVVGPLVALRRVDLQGASPSVSSSLADRARRLLGRNALTASISEIRHEFESDPRVASATVSRRLVNGLEVQVCERRPVAAVRAGAVLLLVGSDGVCVETRTRQPQTLPTIAGLRTAEADVGCRIDPRALVLPLEIAHLARQNGIEPNLTVDVENREDLMIRTQDCSCLLLGDTKQLRQKVSVAAALLRYVRERGWRAQSVDLRTPDVPVWTPL